GDSTSGRGRLRIGAECRQSGRKRNCRSLPAHCVLPWAFASPLFHRDVGTEYPLIRMRFESDLVGHAVERVDAPQENRRDFLLNKIEDLQQQLFALRRIEFATLSL